MDGKVNKVTIDGQTIEALEDWKVSLNGKEFSSLYEVEPILNLLIRAVARLEARDDDTYERKNTDNVPD